MEAGPIQQGLGCIPNLEPNLCLRFLPFSLIGRVRRKGQSSMILIIQHGKHSHVPRVTSYISKNSPIAPRHKISFERSSKYYHLLIQQNSLKLVACTILGKTYRQRELQKGLQTLSPTPGAQTHLNITYPAWGKWVSWYSGLELCPTRCDISSVIGFLA